jgi:hypothetical protein
MISRRTVAVVATTGAMTLSMVGGAVAYADVPTLQQPAVTRAAPAHEERGKLEKAAADARRAARAAAEALTAAQTAEGAKLAARHAADVECKQAEQSAQQWELAWKNASARFGETLVRSVRLRNEQNSEPSAANEAAAAKAEADFRDARTAADSADAARKAAKQRVFTAIQTYEAAYEAWQRAVDARKDAESAKAAADSAVTQAEAALEKGRDGRSRH